MPEEQTSPPSRHGGAATRDASPAVSSMEVTSSPPSSSINGAAGEVAPPVPDDSSTAAPVLQYDDNDGGRKKWFKEMRGWIMVIAVQIAGFTYQAGLNPPGGFSKDAGGEGHDPGIENFRYKVFLYSNTTAFVTSLVIIILLMNRSFYSSVPKVVALEVIVVLDMVGLMAAYWAGSTRMDQRGGYTLTLTVFVVFIVYAVYAVQLLQKIWSLVLHLPELVRCRVPVRHGGVVGDGARPLPDLVVPAAPPQHDAAVWSMSTPRRRSSRLAPISETQQTRTRMLSP